MKKITLSLSLLALSAILIQCTPAQPETQEAVAETVVEEQAEDSRILPSWNDGRHRDRILDFVARVTDTSSVEYVAPDQRFAVFDNDGTLWSEQPIYFQLYFALDRAELLGIEHPEVALEGGYGPLLDLFALTHTAMTAREFDGIVTAWLDTAKHPETNKHFTDMVYQPMLELLDYLRANEFETWIVSGGGIDFMRPWTQKVYGIPPQQVIGSSVQTIFENTGDGPAIRRLGKVDFVDDKEGKPVGIQRHIGRIPILAVGNSDGDLQMLQYTASNELTNMQVYIHHTDSVREWAYDKDSHIGEFHKGYEYALDNDWIIVDMEKDWATIYPE